MDEPAPASVGGGWSLDDDDGGESNESSLSASLATVSAVIGVIDELSDVALRDVERAVGPQSFTRGRKYSSGNRVLAMDWDSDTGTLTGSVVGRGGLYETVAYFVDGPGGGLEFDDGECTCPIGYDCKHVAAVVITALDNRPPARGRRGVAPAVQQPPGWESPLRALIEAPAARSAGKPLAIEVALHEHSPGAPGARRLLAKLMRPGARGGWVNGSLSWNGLDSWHVRDSQLRADHLDLVRELYAIKRAREGMASYYYGADRDKVLDLGECDSGQLWSLLDEAARIGLPLVHALPALGELPPYQRGEVLLDVTSRGDRGSTVTAVLGIDDSDVEGLSAVMFLGSSGHGVVCVEPGEAGTLDAPDRRRLRLVRLARPVPPQLRRMVLRGERLEIPVSDVQRFADEHCPALRSVARVVSSDGSFSPPEISAPSLVLRAEYGDGHALDVGWEWRYRVGESDRSAPLASSGIAPGFRDLQAERAILADALLGESDLGRFGLLDDAGRPAEGLSSTLAGLDSMRFTTDELPRLVERPDITVDVVGEPADYRDVGESLAIGVSTAEIDGDRDWFDLGVSITIEGHELPFAEVFAALAHGESQMLLDDGAHFSLLEPRLQSLRGLIDEARALAESPSSSLRISRYQAGLWAELAALGVVTRQAQAWQRQVDSLLALDSITDHDLPGAVDATLRPYQQDGFAWLAALWEFELGGILADDMGLGKTLQALALICHARERDPQVGPFLVVAPTSVVSNWVHEAARFIPGLRVDAVTETLAKSGRAIDAVAGGADVVVTTYALFRLDAESYGTVAWAGLILDEAQAVKNHQAKTYRCVRELAAPFKLAITGTPMENNLMELWSLLSITAPGLFPDPARFGEHYARPIERRGDAEQLARLRRRIKPLVKRRTKELVAADLPAKQEQTLEVDLHPRHRKLYDTHLQRERQKILGLIDDFDRNRFTILRSITVLRQLSLHPGLVDAKHNAVPCAKLAVLVEQLRDMIGGGHRALVFSQFTGFLAKVRERLDHEGIGYCYLDGSTRRRDRVIERFRTGEDPVFLISLKAGGVGLNLTEADYCFLLDPWWNPATEAQAIDRTHRIGQTRPVMVYRTIASDTIEEKVVALARRKAALFSGVMDDGDLFASGITAEDIRGLLG